MDERFYVVFEDTSEYPRGVYSDKEYDEAFDRLHPDYRPRCRGYDTREGAEFAMSVFTADAVRMYSR